MPSHIGLRHILPIIMTTATISLMVVEYADQRARDQLCKPYCEMFEYSPSRTAQVIFALDIPAILAALPLLILILNLLPSNIANLSSSAAFGLSVVLLWFLVGRWCDRRLGLLPVIKKWTVLTKISFTMIGIATISLSLSSYFRHGWILPVRWLLWSAFGALVLYYRFQDSKADK